MSVCLISFQKKHSPIEVSPGDNLMQSLHRNNIPVGSSCGGEGICSKCALNIISGLENLSEKSEPENQLSIKFGFSKDQRISCQTQVYGDVIIDADYW